MTDTPGPISLPSLAPKAAETFRIALRGYGETLTANFGSFTKAQPEDQLKAPVADLLTAAGVAAGLKIVTRTETRVDGVAGRPDLGVDAGGLPVGNVELKATGKGAVPDDFTDKRSLRQWEGFKDLPNLIYTDGRAWALYRYGELKGELVTLTKNPTKAGPDAATDDDADQLLALLGEFLGWTPTIPSSPKALAGIVAPLTRRLRDEVLGGLSDKEGVMAQLAHEWRQSLFPDADDKTFADGCAQTFTYALLLAHLEGAPSPLQASTAAAQLQADHSLLAQTLQLLGQEAARPAIGMPVDLLERVIEAVDPAVLTANGTKDPWVYFYEDFLAAYDPTQRNNRGVFYTPREVVDCQTRLCQHVLETRFGKGLGFGEADVVVLDPAAGTGTYPISVISHALDKAAAQLGEGMRGQTATQLASNVNAFELLVGPYAVSHLRISRILVDAGAKLPDHGVNVILTDALTAPVAPGYAKQFTLFQRQLAAEQERASVIKAETTRVTVVIGNPPWDRDESQATKDTRRKGGMVRYQHEGTDSPGLIKDFVDPLRAAGAGGHAKNLYNDYVYFWRWAIWKVCEQTDDPGIVSFITASSYLIGPGFAGMREMMRRQFDEIWLVDLGGEGRGTRREENVFDIQTPAVIAVAIRLPGQDPAERADQAALVRYRRVAGTRTAKYEALDKLDHLDPGESTWHAAPTGWADPFIPSGTSALSSYPSLSDLLPWWQSGVQFKRSWPIGEDQSVLAERWETLTSAPEKDRPALLKESRDRKAADVYRSLLGDKNLPALAEPGPGAPEATRRYGFRSFDRRWCLADNRVGDYLRKALWETDGPNQLFLATLTTNPLGAGPAVTVSSHVPDLHYFRGSFGAKDVIPLWRDGQATIPNVTTGLLDTLEHVYQRPVTATDLVAYVFALLGTGAYTDKFFEELTDPECRVPRVPITADPALFGKAVAFGTDLLWWATFGERFQPAVADGTPALWQPAGSAKNTVAVPNDLPTSHGYDPGSQTITINAGELGQGQFAPVSQGVWDFEVSGLKVIQSWLSYRLKTPAGRKSSDLDKIRPKSWAFSAELVELLAVIEHIVAATPVAAELLDDVASSNLIDPQDLPRPTKADRSKPSTASTGLSRLPGT